MKAPEDFAEDGSGKQAVVRYLTEGNHVEDRRRCNRAEGEQSANPDGNRQDCGEPEH